VACALAGSPDILFLDEPTTGLDPQSRRQLWDVCEAFRARGGTILLTTHFMDEAEKLSDRVAILDRGQIIAQGTPAELIRGLGGAHVIELAARRADHLQQRRQRKVRLVYREQRELVPARTSSSSPPPPSRPTNGFNRFRPSPASRAGTISRCSP
jgi:ABC-type multidrug transport system ATPase subunit